MLVVVIVPYTIDYIIINNSMKYFTYIGYIIKNGKPVQIGMYKALNSKAALLQVRTEALSLGYNYMSAKVKLIV